MKRNASLLLLELVIMLLVFSLASAVCLQTFYKADQRGIQSDMEDSALVTAQNVAETLKASKGDLAFCASELNGKASDKLVIHFDKNWNTVSADSSYRLEVIPQTTNNELLGEAQITVFDKDENILSRLSVCWQEVAP